MGYMGCIGGAMASASDGDSGFERLSIDWCKLRIDQSLQRYLTEPLPPGFGVLYAYIRRSGSKRAYLGQSYAFLDRLYKHANAWRWYDDMQLIDRKIHEHGIGDFDVVVLLLLPIAELDTEEELWIKRFQLYPPKLGFGYNLHPGGRNHSPSDETRMRISATMSTPEFKAEHKKRGRKQWEGLDHEERVELVKKTGFDKNWEADSTTTMLALRQTKEGYDDWYEKTVAVKYTDECRENQAAASERRWQRHREQLQREALPFEPDLSLRVAGAVYFMRDGRIGRCRAPTMYILAATPDLFAADGIGPAAPPTFREQVVSNVHEYESVRANRVIGDYYLLRDGRIGRCTNTKSVAPLKPPLYKTEQPPEKPATVREQARASYKPHEPVAQNRIVGAFYAKPDGRIGRCLLVKGNQKTVVPFKPPLMAPR